MMDNDRQYTLSFEPAPTLARVHALVTLYNARRHVEVYGDAGAGAAEAGAIISTALSQVASEFIYSREVRHNPGYTVACLLQETIVRSQVQQLQRQGRGGKTREQQETEHALRLLRGTE